MKKLIIFSGIIFCILSQNSFSFPFKTSNNRVQKSWDYFLKRDYKKSEEILWGEVQKGEQTARCDCWYYGLGYQQNFDKALACFKNEDPTWAAYMIVKGEGTSASRAEAIKYLRSVTRSRNCDKGDIDKFNNLIYAIEKKEPINTMGPDVSQQLFDNAESTREMIAMYSPAIEYFDAQCGIIECYLKDYLVKANTPEDLDDYRNKWSDYYHSDGEMYGFFMNDYGTQARVEGAGHISVLEKSRFSTLRKLFNINSFPPDLTNQYSAADKELNKIYKNLVSRAKPLDEKVDGFNDRRGVCLNNLKKAESDWIKYRDATAKMFCDAHGKFMDPKLLDIQVKTILTQERTIILSDLIRAIDTINH